MCAIRVSEEVLQTTTLPHLFHNRGNVMTQTTASATRPLSKYDRPRNGNGNETPSLPEHRVKQIEAGLATYQQVLAERDELERKLHDSNLKNEQITVQLESLKGIVTMMESTYLQTKMEQENRISTYQAERDEAVARAASYQATLANIYVILRNTVIETDGAADRGQD